MKPTRDTILAMAGWCCLAAFLWAWCSGRAKSPADYAERLLAPLPGDRLLVATDVSHALWSGWWVPTGTERRTNATDPDVLFRSATSGHRCTVDLAAFPLPVDGRAAQRVYLAMNGHAFGGPVIVAADGSYSATNVGDLVAGVNRLSFRLPDAGKVGSIDERIAALGVKSFAFSCESP